jgi:2-hydroxy-4-carboxymuconate semialdehyde hemiacetal dehydrogenase
MNIGLIGYGSIAASHVRAIRSLGDPELRLRAVMGRLAEPAEQFAREHGLAVATTDLDALLADPELDLVVVCSPSDVHAEQTERALRAGKHVLCEIPLALSLANTERLTALADRLDRRLMVCHTQRYWESAIEARRLVAEGRLHVHALFARFMFHRRENVNWAGRRRSWTDNLLWHHGCHAVDTALWLLGAAEAEVAAQAALPGGSLDIPMDLALAMRTPRDQVISVDMSYNTHIPFNDYLVVGEETTLLLTPDALRERERALVERREGDDPIARQDAEFFAAVREGREPAVSGRAVRAAMAALQAAQDALDARLAAAGGRARHPERP